MLCLRAPNKTLQKANSRLSHKYFLVSTPLRDIYATSARLFKAFIYLIPSN
jgi:hypothetical protein